MKVLGIVFSPRKGGNTEILVNESLAAARELGAEVELLTVRGKNITPCDGCLSCRKTLKCKIKDDMQGIFEKVLECDGVIFGTPVYFWGVTAQAKIFIDRSYMFLKPRRLRKKVAGVVVVGDRAGATMAFATFTTFMNIHRMVSAAGAIGYGDDEEIIGERGAGAIAYGHDKGAVRQDARGMSEARALGKAIVRTIETLKSGPSPL